MKRSRTPMLAAVLLCGAFLSPVAAAAAPQEAVRQAGTDVPPPKRTKFVSPVYPPEAQAAGQRGIVILEIVVGTAGQVESVNVVRSVPPFDQAATAAVRQWEYEVTRVDGKPVPVRLTVPITFALRLPPMTRASGIPELRLGAAPALPAEPWSRRDATVVAEVTLDAEGQVADALVTAGESPWTESFLQAVRSWRFVVNAAEPPLAFRVTAHFFAKDKEPSRVDLDLSRPRAAAAEAAPAPAGDAALPVPAASPAAPAPVETETVAPRAADTGALGTKPAAPEVEVVPSAPAPPSAPEGGGGSAVAGVRVGPGVPDLAAGRRPVVPPLARLRAVTGKVEVRFAVEASGATASVDASGDDALKEAARQAVATWMFRRTSAERLRLSATFEYAAESATASVSTDRTP
ncbi:MAG: TonB family protein [Vicinamibacteria bacterium]